MGRVTDKDRDQLYYIDNNTRGEILYRKLHNKERLQQLGAQIFGRDDSFAGEAPGIVTRAYGFHGGKSAGKYSHVPEDAFYDFAAEYSPEDMAGGLDEGTFDWWLRNNLHYYLNNDHDDEEDVEYSSMPRRRNPIMTALRPD